MRKHLLILVMGMVLGSCSKDSSNSTDTESQPSVETNLVIVPIKADRDSIGSAQLITISTEKPENAGQTVTYRWVVSDPTGKNTETVNNSPELTFLTSDSVGEYIVVLYAQSLSKEGKSEYKFSTRKNDFEQGNYGDSKELIKASFEKAGKQQLNILTGFYWPFEDEIPKESVTLNDGTYRITYLFSNNELIGGSRVLYNVPFAAPRPYNAYSNYFSIAVNYGKKLFEAEGNTTYIWRGGELPSDTRLRYEELTGNDDYLLKGLALWEGALIEVNTEWGNALSEGKSNLKRSSSNGHDISFAVRKR